MRMTRKDKEEADFIRYQKDWLCFARDFLNVCLDEDQQKILKAVQHNRRISVRSGNGRGKDFVAAAAAICFLFLVVPSIVIMTAPTERQAIQIMMAEVKKIYLKAKFKLGGKIIKDGIMFSRSDRKLLAFKSSDYVPENWTGFHSPNLMVIVTEASGINDLVFNSIESILTGNSKLLIMFNPNQAMGEAWRSVKDPSYKKFKLNCLNAPNVIAKKNLIPGQVDYGWVVDKLKKWCMAIDHSQLRPENGDFEFEGKCYHPNDLFMVKVLGEFPREGEDKLIPLSWIEAAQQRWRDRMNINVETIHESSPRSPMMIDGDFGSQAMKDKYGIDEELRLGVDVAGMGTDMTVFCYRYANLVAGFKSFVKMDHMETAGRIKAELEQDERNQAFIDALGEGAGVCSRLLEQELKAVSVKFSESAKGFYDYTEQRKFVNMRAYCWWAIRDALDPQHEEGETIHESSLLALPPIDELTQDLNEPRWSMRSDGSILIEDKDEIKARLGRSPDYGDALALSFYPIYYTVKLGYEPVMWR